MKDRGRGKVGVMDRKKPSVSICPGVLKIRIFNFAYFFDKKRHFIILFDGLKIS